MVCPKGVSSSSWRTLKCLTRCFPGLQVRSVAIHMPRAENQGNASNNRKRKGMPRNNSTSRARTARKVQVNGLSRLCNHMGSITILHMCTNMSPACLPTCQTMVAGLRGLAGRRSQTGHVPYAADSAELLEQRCAPSDAAASWRWPLSMTPPDLRCAGFYRCYAHGLGDHLGPACSRAGEQRNGEPLPRRRRPRIFATRPRR